MTKSVKLTLAKQSRNYDVRIGAGVVNSIGRYLPKMSAKKLAVLVADERLIDAREATKAALNGAGWNVREVAVAAGERLKEIDSVFRLYGELLRAGADRDSVLFALGGGSVGDAAGFVASTYMRGIAWVGLPTTILAHVDSSIGGKTAINHTSGKNLIGTFHQPSLVVCDTEFLKTLSRREVVSGFGETVKYAITYDPAFYRYLVKSLQGFLALDQAVLTYAIERSVRWKIRAVARDEFDRKGVREVLNFGHTFGHALEATTRYEVYQHGEAVLWGMRFALALSRVRKRLAEKAYRELDAFLATLPVPPLPSGVSANQLFAAMLKDKKVRNGRINFVLLRALGQPVSDNQVTEAHLAEAFKLLSAGGDI